MKVFSKASMGGLGVALTLAIAPAAANANDVYDDVESVLSTVRALITDDNPLVGLGFYNKDAAAKCGSDDGLVQYSGDNATNDICDVADGEDEETASTS